MELYFYLTAAVVLVIVTIIAVKKQIKKREEKAQFDLENKVNEIAQQMERNFEDLTNKSLAKNAEFVQNLSTNGIDVVLRPLVQQLKEHEQKMDRMAKDEACERATLKELIRSVNDINQSFSEDAQKFVVAVRGNIHAIGRWGEDTLQNILDSSGFNEGKDYEKQKGHKNSDEVGIRPDFIIRAPQNRGVMVDSKLSMDSFFRYVEATDENEGDQAAKDLVKNINTHVTELSKKKYQEIKGIDAFDYVMMFVSSDAALSVALSYDKEILRNALAKNVLIVGPTTLMATLKTVEFLWREQKQMENLKEIGESGKRLYEKLYHFVEKMNDVQKFFDKANNSLKTASNYLEKGNKSIVNEAKNLKELGIKSEKVIKTENKDS